MILCCFWTYISNLYYLVISSLKTVFTDQFEIVKGILHLYFPSVF